MAVNVVDRFTSKSFEILIVRRIEVLFSEALEVGLFHYALVSKACTGQSNFLCKYVMLYINKVVLSKICEL